MNDLGSEVAADVCRQKNTAWDVAHPHLEGQSARPEILQRELSGVGRSGVGAGREGTRGNLDTDGGAHRCSRRNHQS